MTAADLDIWGQPPSLPRERPRLRLRVEECDCRGLITAAVDPVTWADAVRLHNASDQHQLWWRMVACEWQGEE